MADTHIHYAHTLGNLTKFSEAAVVQKLAISVYRDLAQTGNE